MSLLPRQSVQTTRAIERELDIMQLLQAMGGTMTQFVDLVRGMTVNGVLSSELVTIRSDGTWTRDFTVPFAAMFIVNLGANPMYVTNDGPSNPPTNGPGVRLIPSGSSIVTNLAGRALTLYGIAGQQANVEIHTKPLQPSYVAPVGSITSISGGTP